MEGAYVSTTRWRSAMMHQTEVSAHVDGTFAAGKGVMLLMLKKITTRRRSDMPKAALALLVEAGVDLNECLIVEVLQEGLLRP